MLYLFGAGGHAKVVLEIAEELDIPVGGILDNDSSITKLLNYPVVSPASEDLIFSKITIAIGNNATRKRLSELYFQKKFVSLFHPNAFISKRASVGIGTVVMPGASINSSVCVGNHVIVNTNASIDHDCEISDYAHIGPNAALAGNVRVGEGALIGIGACVKQGIKIGNWAIIGAGAVVVSDIPDSTLFYGNPARGH